ncbi:hypothetical protein HN415_05730 [Candidatus Woesearchaeota archaeon]|jgi:hypothetical protein|nr:hypothetical protein [Candidatus Woesearchaeota archaeon]
MELINQLLLSIVIFLGTICGYALSLIAPEELIPGKNYLKFFYSIVVGLIIAMTLNPLYKIISWIIFFLIVYLTFKLKYSKYLYLIIGLILLTPNLINYNLIIILLFILGFGVTSIEAVKFTKNNKIKQEKKLLILIIKRYIWIIPITLLPYALSNL